MRPGRQVEDAYMCCDGETIRPEQNTFGIVGCETC
jgi:hypothetical protein